MYQRITALLLVSTLVLTGCDNDDSDGSRHLSDKLTILVTNDDGIGAPGIDVLVNELVKLDNVEVVVVAPAENKSGSSDNVTEGAVTWQAAVTTSGYAGFAVNGFPADSVKVALEQLAITPDLVVSGVNPGQNVGPYATLSGTVGAARFAARAGIPAVATSVGLGGDGDFAAGAALAIDWIEDHRDVLANNSARTDVVISFNVPGCTAGEMRELISVPLAAQIPDGANVFATDCSVEPGSAPINDVDAMMKGFAAVTEVPLEL
jgi:5'-nucleotidase